MFKYTMQLRVYFQMNKANTTLVGRIGTSQARGCFAARETQLLALKPTQAHDNVCRTRTGKQKQNYSSIGGRMAG
jgi:hypothetical protein